MMSQTGQQIITIHILGNILSKSNQAMKLYQLKKIHHDKYFSSEIIQTMM